GFRRARSHALVEIDDCAIADPALVAHLGIAREWVARLRAVPNRLTLARAADGVVLVADTRRCPGPTDVEATEDLLARHASVRGAVLSGAGARVVVGDPHVPVPLEPDLQLEVPADTFTQVNPSTNLLLVATVLELAGGAAGWRVLDLYCGAGNFTPPLAPPGADVLRIQRSQVAVPPGPANAARPGIPRARLPRRPAAPQPQRPP